MDATRGRAGRWMDAVIDGRFLAVADPSVVRAALVHALSAGPASAWRIDVEPLAGVVLERATTGWRLVLGAPLRTGG